MKVDQRSIYAPIESERVPIPVLRSIGRSIQNGENISNFYALFSRLESSLFELIKIIRTPGMNMYLNRHI